MPTIGRVAAALVLALTAAVPFGAPSAEADHDRNWIEQLMAGANGNPAIQFVQLKMLADAENCQGTAAGDLSTPVGVCAPAGPGASLRFFDAGGIMTAEFRFPSNTPVGLQGRAILIATAEFAALGTTPPPDFIMPPHVVANSGKVCYTSRPGTVLFVDTCVSYGNYFSGSVEGFGSPAPALPITGLVSLRRVSGQNVDNSLDFALDTPAPTNNAGQTGSVAGAAPLPVTLAAATLPTSRSVQVSATATAFATIINAGHAEAIGCSISLDTSMRVTLSFQPTDAQNQSIGPANGPINIPPNGGRQNFLIAVTPHEPIAPTDLALRFDCANSEPATINSGVNTLLFSASAAPVPDIVALASTLDNDGIVKVPGAAGTGVFAVASVNVGAPGSITVAADTGSAALPVALSICRTNPATAACLQPAESTATVQIGAGETPTFSIFVAGTGTVPFDPGAHRIFVRFRDASNELRGATSVAVRTE